MTEGDRVESARRMLRERRVLVDPDPQFADRVLARLRDGETWMLAWAAKRILPVTLALAAVLTVAILATHELPGRAGPTAASSSESQGTSDPLDWLLDAREEVR